MDIVQKLRGEVRARQDMAASRFGVQTEMEDDTAMMVKAADKIDELRHTIEILNRDIVASMTTAGRLRAALEAADYYIDRLEAAQRRKVVRDMTEAMTGYETARRALQEVDSLNRVTDRELER